MPYEGIPTFMATLRELDGPGSLALEFLILTATRSAETLGACWEEFDLKEQVWTIRPSRVKNGERASRPAHPRNAGAPRPDRRGKEGRLFPGRGHNAMLKRLEAHSRLRRLYRARLPLQLPRLVRQRDRIRPRCGRGDLRPRGRQRRRACLSPAEGDEEAPPGAGGWNRYAAESGTVVPFAKTA